MSHPALYPGLTISFLKGLSNRTVMSTAVKAALAAKKPNNAYTLAEVRNSFPGHESSSDKKEHTTVRLKTESMMRDKTHQRLHIYHNADGTYHDAKLYSQVLTDDPPPKK